MKKVTRFRRTVMSVRDMRETAAQAYEALTVACEGVQIAQEELHGCLPGSDERYICIMESLMLVEEQVRAARECADLIVQGWPLSDPSERIIVATDDEPEDEQDDEPANDPIDEPVKNECF